MRVAAAYLLVIIHRLNEKVYNSYPFVTEDEMVRIVEESGLQLHEDLIPSFQMAEISATQQAIHHYTNPDLKPEYEFASAASWNDYQLNKDLVTTFDPDYVYYTIDPTPPGWERSSLP